MAGALILRMSILHTDGGDLPPSVERLPPLGSHVRYPHSEHSHGCISYYVSKRHSSAHIWCREPWIRHKRHCDRRLRGDLLPPAVVTPPHMCGILTSIT